MAREGVPFGDPATRGTVYSSTHETAVLRDFFSVPGSPTDFPFRAVWEEGDNVWRNNQYAGRTLQRIRDKLYDKKVLSRRNVQGNRVVEWAVNENSEEALRDYLKDAPKVRLVDLAIWYGRDQDVADLNELIGWFRATFPVVKPLLMKLLYDESVPREYLEFPFQPEPATQDDYAALVGAAPTTTPILGAFSDIVSRLEGRLTKAGFELPPKGGLVARVLNAWARGDMVILTGQPGTGKSKFAQLIAKAFAEENEQTRVTTVPVRADFDESDLIGYEGLDGRAKLRPFAERVILTDDPLSPHLLILEECNLATIEAYLAQVLVALQDDSRQVDLPGGETAALPVDTLIIATCNSYLDEPETRARLSFPSKRRAAVISMPNVLAEKYRQSGKDAIVPLASTLIQQEKGRVETRVAGSLNTALDGLRSAALAGVSNAESLSSEFRDKLTEIVSHLLDTPEGNQYLTLGLLRDVVLAAVYGGRGAQDELTTLGQQVADKIIHQMRGPKARLAEFKRVVADLPNAAELNLLLDRMAGGPGDQIATLV
jgi:MoxR-like ATPase